MTKEILQSIINDCKQTEGEKDTYVKAYSPSDFDIEEEGVIKILWNKKTTLSK
tara:strand:+ start:7840 stop:7998 length:159 start_codon:yes stop_codon:yes gene_type:complete